MANKPNYKPKKKKVVDFRDQRLFVPEFPLLYETKRVYWLMQALSASIEEDPSSVNPKAYMEVVSKFSELAIKCKKEGIQNAKGRERKRMDNEGVAEVGHEINEATMGELKSDGVGSGVRTSNPFA